MNTRAIVESGDEYVKFGNGLLIQFFDGGSASTSQTYTFPKPFTVSPMVVCTVQSSWTGSNFCSILTKPTETSVTIEKRNTRAFLIAIGY